MRCAPSRRWQRHYGEWILCHHDDPLFQSIIWSRIEGSKECEIPLFILVPAHSCSAACGTTDLGSGCQRADDRRDFSLLSCFCISVLAILVRRDRSKMWNGSFLNVFHLANLGMKMQLRIFLHWEEKLGMWLSALSINPVVWTNQIGYWFSQLLGLLLVSHATFTARPSSDSLCQEFVFD